MSVSTSHYPSSLTTTDHLVRGRWEACDGSDDNRTRDERNYTQWRTYAHIEHE